jgi:hypothetical protein
MSARKSASRKSPRKTVHERSRLVLEDMLRNPSLSLTKAARKRKVDPRSVVSHFPTQFRKDSSGRVKARGVTGKLKILYIPGSEPGEVIPVPTNSEEERLLLGRWMAAVNAAGRGDFSKIDKFPKNKRVGGVVLPTKRAEIQQILVNLAEQESPFEGLYRTIVRRR